MNNVELVLKFEVQALVFFMWRTVLFMSPKVYRFLQCQFRDSSGLLD